MDHVTSSELPHELVAYRGMHNIDPSTLKKGDTFTDRGFASHPLDPMVAARFTDKIRTPYFGAEKRHVFRCTCRRGAGGTTSITSSHVGHAGETPEAVADHRAGGIEVALGKDWFELVYGVAGDETRSIRSRVQK